MDNIFPSSLFTLQQNDDDFELLVPAFTTANTTSADPSFVFQQDSLPRLNQDLQFDDPPLAAEASRRKGKKQPESSAAAGGVEGDSAKDDKQRRAHKEIERQRRQEMAALYASLRNELPLEYLRGKRSTSDHIREAVRYIEHKQKRIRELETKRDKLKRVATSVLSDPIGRISSGSDSSPSIMVKIQPSIDGVEILINCGSSNPGFRVSSVLEVLHEERLNVVSCFCSSVEGSLLHAIRTEVSPETSVDLQMLRQKVTDKIKLTSPTI